MASLIRVDVLEAGFPSASEQDFAIVDTVVIDNPAEKGVEVEPIRLPSAPYSFSGKLVSLIWALELVAFPGETSTRVDITMAPDGKEVVL